MSTEIEQIHIYCKNCENYTFRLYGSIIDDVKKLEIKCAMCGTAKSIMNWKRVE